MAGAPLYNGAVRRLILGLLLLAVACDDAEKARIRATTKAQYSAETGKLIELTYDNNKNGVIDTWTKMDGSHPISSVLDQDEDGVIDRWEYYDSTGRLEKAAWVRFKPTHPSPDHSSKPDAWAYMGPDGKPDRVELLEVSSVTGREGVVRREFYSGTTLVRAEEDTDGDAVMDRWETWAGGRHMVEFDTFLAGKASGKPDTRFTYDVKGVLVLIESLPDAAGVYQKRVVPGIK